VHRADDHARESAQTPSRSRPEGWIMLRFTWHDLDTRPGYVLSEIRAALAAAA
jgi:very-short-patch-repair endonuclease